MKTAVTNMRVLLLTALVAGTYAQTGYADWDAAYDADATADKPALPTGTDAANVAYDGVLVTQVGALVTALTKMDATDATKPAPDFTAAKTAIDALVVGCKAWQAIATAWPTALTAAQKTGLNTAGKAAFAVSWANYHGTCVTTAAAADVPTSPESQWKVTCEAAAGGVWTADATAATASATQWDLMVADFGDDWTTATGCDTFWGKDGAAWKDPSFALIATTANKDGVWPAAASTTSGSDTSPAAALAAGVAAIALLF